MRKNKNGFLLFEITVSLLIDIIIVSIILISLFLPVNKLFEELSTKYYLTETFTYLRASSATVYSGNTINRIDRQGIFYSNVRIDNNYFYFHVSDNNIQGVYFSLGKTSSLGGTFRDKKGNVLYNVLPVTGILTNPN